MVFQRGLEFFDLLLLLFGVFCATPRTCAAASAAVLAGSESWPSSNGQCNYHYSNQATVHAVGSVAATTVTGSRVQWQPGRISAAVISWFGFCAGIPTTIIHSPTTLSEICLATCLSDHLSTCLFMRLSTCLFASSYACLTHVYPHLFTSLYACLTHVYPHLST